MFRILLVDDEPYVVEWISRLIETRLDCEIDICTAGTAAEALRWMERAKIDIVVSDIHMPGMDGMKLMHEIRGNWPLCKIIFLTAYAEFEYAYTAMGNQASGYLLKSESDEKIVAEIERVLAALRNELDLKERLARQEMSIELTYAVQNTLLHQLVKGERGEEPALYSELQQAGIQIEPTTRILLLLGRLNAQDGKQDERRSAMLHMQRKNRVKQIVSLYMEARYQCVAVDCEYENTLWLLTPNICKEDSSATHSAQIGGILETVQQSSMQTFGEIPSFIYGPALILPHEIADMYPQMQRQLPRQIDCRAGIVVQYQSLQQRHPRQSHYVDSTVNAIKGYLYEMRWAKLLAKISEVARRLSDYADPYDAFAFQLYYSVAALLAGYIDQKDYHGQLREKATLSKIFYAGNVSSWGDSAGALLQAAQHIVEIQENAKQDLPNKIIHTIQEYIQQNITMDISLIRLSELTGYNPSYLSRTYSDLTGETIGAYASRLKMEKITAYMRNPDLSITDISEQAGFSSRPYFNHFVKRNTGMPPNKYRQNIVALDQEGKNI
jgi:two-component system response regulator YesN